MQENSINLILQNLSEVLSVISETRLPIDFIKNQFQYQNKEELSILVAILSYKFTKTVIGKKITSN